MRKSESLDRDTAARAVADRLRGEIQDGFLEPGSLLRQNEIAERFGVSTTPVREAFAQLQADGLVRIDPHRGAVVFRPTVEDLVEFYRIREVLESLAVARAIPNWDEDVEKELDVLVDRMRRTEDARRWLKLNDEFHLRLYRRCRMPRLVTLIENLRRASTPYIHMFVTSRPPAERANEEHQAILDACRRRDHAAAERAIRGHLTSAATDLVRYLEQARADGVASGSSAP